VEVGRGGLVLAGLDVGGFDWEIEDVVYTRADGEEGICEAMSQIPRTTIATTRSLGPQPEPPFRAEEDEDGWYAAAGPEGGTE
jgi:hypothetical protein